MVALPIDEALRQVERMIPKAPYEDVMAAVDACDRLPDAEQNQLGIRGMRLFASHVYERDDEEIERWLVPYMDIAGSVPLIHRASSIYAACASSARLAATYLPPLIAELCTAIDMATGQERDGLTHELSITRGVCARLGVDVR